jgi:hypothetical protein
MIMHGQWDEAQDKLAAVNAHVQTVKDSIRKQDLIDQVNLLTAKVATRDPNATKSPDSRPNSGIDSATGTTAAVTASETTSDTSAAVTSSADPSASLSMSAPTSSTVPAAGVTASTTAASSGDPANATQQPNQNGG